jgi:hypothetical protein
MFFFIKKKQVKNKSNRVERKICTARNSPSKYEFATVF